MRWTRGRAPLRRGQGDGAPPGSPPAAGRVLEVRERGFAAGVLRRDAARGTVRTTGRRGGLTHLTVVGRSRYVAASGARPRTASIP